MKTVAEAGSPSTKVPLSRRLRAFLSRPPRAKYAAIALRVQSVFPAVPFPIRLPFGGWWLARGSALDSELLLGSFERAELAFVEKFVQPGMVFLDVGAHHGLYTLLASRKVGPAGKVIAFEPSPRERKRLKEHLRLNACRNVTTEDFALSDLSRTADLYLVDGSQDWCNSLRPPRLTEKTHAVSVRTVCLDEYLSRHSVSSVDFVKLDVEGAELSVLLGAKRLLASASRPVFLVEVQDIRTGPWGYRAREIVSLLIQNNYLWYSLTGDGLLLPARLDVENFDANLVAIPAERDKIVAHLLG